MAQKAPGTPYNGPYHSSPSTTIGGTSHSSSAGPSRKRSWSPTTYVPVYSPILGALSPVCADLLPPPKRIRSSNFVMDLETEIDEFIAYVDALRSEGIDARVVVKIVAREEVETSTRGMVEAIEGIQRDQGHRIVATGQQGAVMSERISKLERDNTRLRGMLDVASQRVTRFQHRELLFRER
ncbi:hypothetical protein Tco_0190095 [Tanacetum coccineum]